LAFGDVTLNASIFFATIAAVLSIMRLLGWRIEPRYPRVTVIFTGLMGLVTLSFLFSIFLSSDLDYQIVHDYSSTDLPTAYKLSGSWAGQAGSLVLWTSLLLMAWTIEEIRWWWRARRGTEPSEEKEEEPEEEAMKDHRERARERRAKSARRAKATAEVPQGWLTLDLVRTVVMVIAIILLTATTALEPFAENEDLIPAEGRSLNPALRTPLMAIHPPIVFIAYALMTITFGAALAYALRGDKRWVDISRPWTRMAWLTLTLGIGIGAMWAYETLGWGGYWAWDPVETSSFIPWIALTAFMHAQVQHERSGGYRLLTPLLAGMGMFLVIFATFVTRSGVWASVHAYASASSGTAMDRVSEVISQSPSLYWIYAGMWIVLLATLFPSLWRLLRAKEEEPILPPRREGESVLEWLARGRTTMLSTVFLLSVSMLLTLLLLLAATDGDISPGEYHGRLAVFLVPLMVVLVICMGIRALDRRKASTAAVVAVVAGVVAWAINPGDMDPPIVWLGAVVGIFGILAVLMGGGRLIMRNLRSPRHILRMVGSNLLHMGVAMVFMAYCLSNVPAIPESTNVLEDASGTVELDDVSVVLEDRVWEQDTGVKDRGEDWDTFKGTVVVRKDGEVKSEGTVEVVSKWQYREFGTLTYEEGGVSKTLHGEVVAKELTSSQVLVRLQEYSKERPRSAVTDLRLPTSDLSPWPGLYIEAANLTGEIVRIEDETETWEGFLVSVESVRGNVTIATDGEEVVIPPTSVQKLWRKAYVSLAITDVYVHRSILEDTYVTVLYAQPMEDGTFSARVLVKTIPAMSFLWFGMYLMSAGVVLRPLEGLKVSPKGQKEAPDEAPGPENDGPEAMNAEEEEEG
jgi:cytochrome c-type biogenesis protein CcmF